MSKKAPNKAQLEKERIIRQKKKAFTKKDRRWAYLLTLVVGGLFAYTMYLDATSGDGYTRNEVYEIDNIAMDVLVDDKYSSKILNGSVTLVVYGDDEKVANMKEKKQIPDVILDVKDKGSGEYEVVPEVTDKLIGLTYEFSPSVVDVEVIEAVNEPYKVVERYYGLANEGYYIEKLVAKEEAVLTITEDEKLEIGNVVVEIDASKVTQSGVYQANVVVLDKRGNVMDVRKATETVDVEVTYSPLGWLQITNDMAVIRDEITTLETELTEKQQQIKEVSDVLRKNDIQKEIDFRTTRLQDKRKELEEKEASLVGLKEKQENDKKVSVKESLLNGGALSSEELGE